MDTLDISANHSCACTCIAMAIVRACVGNVLDVRVAGGFSLKVRILYVTSPLGCV